MSNTQTLLDDVSRFIAESRGLLQSGAILQLAGLDRQVLTLCDAVLRLSQEERVRYADRLQELLGELKCLGDEMVVQRDLIADEIRGMPQHKKASVAYRKTDASDGYHEGDKD